MPDTYASLKLSHAAALKALEAGMAKARAINQPQCITVVDDGGHLLAFVRMDGAKFVSIDSSHNKAVSAASARAPTGPRGNSDMELKLAITTRGRNLSLKGGVPVIVGGVCVGAVGVGSGTGEQDREVALAAVATIEGAKTDFVFND
ncbi:MAG: heme-binding protein [Betaproteobacteria bacterium]|nr:heme-binding protein [Betaproteobacteria bacterium]